MSGVGGILKKQIGSIGGHMTEQVKSKQRVVDHGEVFTNQREVNAMLDMVKQETERIESRFLEPACGNGNFLAEVLRRKLEVVRGRYGQSLPEYERYAFVAVGSIYGVELLADNVQECRDRLYGMVVDAYEKASKGASDKRFLPAIEYVLSRNVLCGDALSLKADDGESIIFSEWSLVTGDKVKRRDFRLDEMLEGNVDKGQTRSLFGADYSSAVDWEYDEETESFIPKPIREFPLTSFYEVMNVE